MHSKKVIETKEDFDVFAKEVNTKLSICIPIFSDQHLHPAVNSISVLFVFVGPDLYILGFNHNETLNLPLSYLNDINPYYMVVPNKKRLLFHVRQGNLIDFSTIEYQKCGELTNWDQYRPQLMMEMQRNMRSYRNINSSISIMKLLEYAEECRNQIIRTFDDRYVNTFMNDTLIPTCQFIEQSGIHVDVELFKQHNGKQTSRLIHNELIYSEYNPYTTTGRCSNAFGGINFAAINKHDGSRNAFTSRFDNGKMLLIDFESFHLRLAANMINYPSPKERFHEYLGKQYFDVDKLTPEQYEESKRKSFSYLYGAHRPDKDIPFFQSIQKKIDEFWNTFKNDGCVEYLDRQFYAERMFEPTREKLFSYIMQWTETYVSMTLINLCIPIFRRYKSKLVLYTYDSILIDLHPDESFEIPRLIIPILQCDGKFPVRIYFGSSYGEVI